VKQGWERVREAVALPPDVASEMIARPLPGHRLLSVELMGGGLSNSNYRIRTRHKTREHDFVIRVHVRSPADAAKERAISRRLASRILVPEVLHHDDSRALFDHSWSLVQWVHGCPLDDLVAQNARLAWEQALRDAGRVLAALQSVELDAPGFLDQDLGIATPLDLDAAAYRTYIDEHLTRRRGWDQVPLDLVRPLRDFVERESGRLETVRRERSLVHADYNGANVLVHRGSHAWEVSAVLDWEFAFAGSTLVDVGNMIRHVGELGPRAADPFVIGFRENGGRLPDDWWTIAVLLDLMSLVDFLTRPELGPAMIADVTGRIAQVLEEWRGGRI
jgi:aminoglycoside phosphotransferase (APT) family kinase protein